MTGVLVIAGLLLVSSPGGVAMLAWLAWRRHRRISSAIAWLTCDQLDRAEELPRWAAIAGRTAAQGDQLLRAPRSGTECVWYQIEYARSPSGDDRLERWVEFHPGAELVAVDDGTSTVFLAPDLARTTLAGPPIATISGGGREGELSWQEVTIAPDIPVLAIGRPARAADVGPLRTMIVEKGPWILPHAGFTMGTGHRPSPQQDGVVLESGWRSPCGVTSLPAEQIRRGYAVRLKWTLVALLALPVLGAALIGLAGALQS